MTKKTIPVESGLLRRYTGSGGAVTLPAGLTAVGCTAFFRREDVTSVTLPDGLESIGGSAFAECTALERVTMPESLSGLGSWTFCGCGALKEIRLPSRLRRIEERTFWRCAALETAVLPEELESLGAETFRRCSSLREIVFPETLRGIGEGAFEDCASLTAVQLPEGPESIPRRAFRGCRSLRSVRLPGSVRFVEAEAFAGCASLREIEFPESVRSIAPTALEGCGALERITLRSAAADTAFVPEGVPVVAPEFSLEASDRPMELALGFAMARREGVCYSPKRQAEYTEYLRAQGSILAPMALTGCPGLLEALIDAEAIPAKDVDALLALCPTAEKRTALLGCRGRQEADAAPDLWDDAELELSLDPLPGEEAEERWTCVPDGDGLTVTAWKGGEREIYVPARIGDRDVTAVGERAFSPLQSGLTAAERRAREEITGIYLPYGVRRIGDEAFRGCAALSELMLPDEPASIGRSAFLGTPWWEAMPDGCVYLGRILYRFKGSMASGTCIEVREGTVYVAQGAFRDLEELASITLPPGLETIGPMAFYNNAGLKTIVFPGTLKEIGEYAFHGCAALEEVILPDGFMALGDRAFYGCRRLRSIRAPESLVSIGRDVFRRCDGLVLRAPAGSAAERYAGENGIPFLAEEDGIRKGDRL